MRGRYSIEQEAFKLLAAGARSNVEGGVTPCVPISRHIPADLETPVSALLKIRRGGRCFLLESVERGNQVGRYSFLGTEPNATLLWKEGSARIWDGSGSEAQEERPCADPFGELARLISKKRLVVPEDAEVPRFSGGAVGYAGYETVCTLEPVQPARHDVLQLPDLAFAFYDTFVAFDHVQRTAQVVTLAPLTGDLDTEYRGALQRIEQLVSRLREPMSPQVYEGRALGTPVPVKSNMEQAEYEELVERAKRHIAAGDVIQVVLSQRFSRIVAADPFTIYRALRMVNPSPYMFYLQLDDSCLVGSSPEMLVSVEGRKVSTRPIAGTRPRGDGRAEDLRLERELLADEKERAEHLMLVDLGRNDIGRIASIGSVSVPRFMEIERYSHVMHIVSEVEGELREGLGAVDALRSCFPAGTLSGAPKVRAMQIIAEQEQDRRGPYGGAAGYVSYNGNMDTAIIIRTVAVKDGVAHVQAGAGLVADSVPQTEYRETLAKSQAVLSALDLAEQMERDA